MSQTCWQILGIEQTEDAAQIERAYNARLAELSSESHGEQQAQLTQAYNQALLTISPPQQSEPEVDGGSPPVTEVVNPDIGEPAADSSNESVDESVDESIDKSVDKSQPETTEPMTSEAEQFANERPRQAEKPHYLKNTLVFIAWIAALFLMVKAFVLLLGEPIETSNVSQDSDASSLWDEDLLACNDVVNAELTDAFNQCLSLAEEGWEEAQRRIAWAYTRDHETRDWGEAYDWVTTIAEYDREADFLANVMLFVLGDDDESKRTGEKRIKAKANIRYAPAEAYLATIYGLGLNQIRQDARIIWLLESAYANDDRLISAYEMAQVHFNGLGTRVNIEKARKVIEEYTHSDAPYSINNAAWFLATTANNQIFEPQEAIELASSIVDFEDESERYSFVDTLAAAYAANNDFQRAVATQEKAIELLASSALSEEEKAEERESYEERLLTYKNEESVVYDDLMIEATDFFNDLKDDIESLLLGNLHQTISPPEYYQAPTTE